MFKKGFLDSKQAKKTASPTKGKQPEGASSSNGQPAPQQGSSTPSSAAPGFGFGLPTINDGFDGRLSTATEQRAEQRDLLSSAFADYEDVKSTLTSLPDKVRHEVMVPLGPLAFMPGSLRHTNEITALLGENYYAEVSAKQACGIVERRQECKLGRSISVLKVCRRC